ncbi:uncharacterized protein LOC143913217 [Arctopsyche grandis]|uniref:uncharacterized protein LOC143913217 n=1 Tax=Arctopsyche grandis TaxID=121162 RepID=UPI00406D9C46
MQFIDSCPSTNVLSNVMDSEELTSEYEESTLSVEIPNLDSRITEYNDLCTTARRLHASYLFHREKISTDAAAQLCQKIYINMARRIGGTIDNLYTSGWKDLGYHLGLTAEEINYIDNSMKACPTESILRVFCQGETSNFEQIIQSLIKMERFDVIEGIFDPLKSLLDILNNTDSDQGYNSNSGNDTMIKPNYFANNLPEVLRWSKKDDVESKETDLPIAMMKINKPCILLTYFDDGIDIAERIYKTIQNQQVVNKQINVICLENEKLDVLTNPEQYIRYYFDEVNYVIPILTEGYLKTIRSPMAVCSSSTNNIDCSYARFIYTLMSSDYINGSGCINRKVRCILPLGINRKLLVELSKNPLLAVWIWENQIDKLISNLFR